MPGVQTHSYAVHTSLGDPTGVIAELARDGWRVRCLVPGFFDRTDRWCGIGWTIIAEREYVPPRPKPSQKHPEAVAENVR